jgi:ribosome-associated protein
MLALQDVGAELVRLTPEVIRRLDLPEDLRDAVLDAQRIAPSKHGGKKRQLQYIGRLMRSVDAAPIIEQLQSLNAPSQKQTAQHHLAERWRDRMLADSTALAAFMNDFPEADRDTLEKYLLGAHDDRAKSRPPKHFRLLYRALLKYVTAQVPEA